MIEQESAQALPAGSAEMPPGPELSAALATVDRTALSGFDLIVLLRARSRRLAFEQAELAADMVAVRERVKVESSKLSWVWNSDQTTGRPAHRLRKMLAEADLTAARKRYERSVAERKVVRGVNADGTGHLSGCNLPADEAAAADERLDALARAAKQAGDDRPMDHIRADIFLGLLAGTWDGPPPVGRRGVIELTVDLPTLMGLADHVADLAGWGPVIADIARKISAERGAEAIWRYTVTNPLTGGLLHHGTTRPPATTAPPHRDPRRSPTSRQRAFVIARDRTCRGPGCRVPAHRAEIDHIVEHADGGPTRISNLDAKCAACHDLKDAGWTTRRNLFDDTTWISLLGQTHRVPAQPVTPPMELGILERHFLDCIRMRT